MKRKAFSILFVLMLVISFSMVPAAAVAGDPTTWTVDDDGVECPTAHFTHPQDAVNAANPGDTILVYPGTYGSRVFTTKPPHWGLSDQYAPALIVYKDSLTIEAVNPDPSNTVIQSKHTWWSNPVAIQASTGGTWDGTKYVGAGVNPWDGTAPNTVAIIADYVTIDGFKIVRAHDSVTGNTFNSAPVMIGGLYAGDPQFLPKGHNTVKNCILGGVGYYLTTSLQLQSSTESWTGVYIWHSSDNIIENNIVYDINWRALQIYDGYSDSQIAYGSLSKNNQFINNEVYNAWGGLFVGAWAPSVWTDNSGTVIQGNYFHDLTDFGILFGFTDSGNVEISGNTMENTVHGIRADTALLHDSLIDSNYIRLSDLGPWQNGIDMNSLNGVIISNNDIQDNTNGWAIVIWNSNDVEILDNDVINNAYGIAIVNSKDVEAHCNSIVGNGAGFAPYGPYPALFNSLGVGDPNQYIVDATVNWWGDVSGPYHPGSWTYYGVEITNPDGQGDEVTNYVLYEPWKGQEGMATGGGWFIPEASSAHGLVNPGGKATFGFVAKQKNETSSGQLEFQYHADDLKLKSTSYDWVSVASVQVMFEGEGVLNGVPGYKFRVWAFDGDKAGGQPDRFTIRIWTGSDSYGSPTYRAEGDLGGGQIVVHKK